MPAVRRGIIAVHVGRIDVALLVVVPTADQVDLSAYGARGQTAPRGRDVGQALPAVPLRAVAHERAQRVAPIAADAVEHLDNAKPPVDEKCKVRRLA